MCYGRTNETVHCLRRKVSLRQLNSVNACNIAKLVRDHPIMAAVSGGLETALCRELGLECPIFSVGFAMSAGPSLVAAVSNAGGCGVLGAGSGAMPIDEVRRRIRRVRELTERPFGLNMIIAGLEHPEADEEDRAFVHARIALAIEERVPVLVLG